MTPLARHRTLGWPRTRLRRLARGAAAFALFLVVCGGVSRAAAQSTAPAPASAQTSQGQPSGVTSGSRTAAGIPRIGFAGLPNELGEPRWRDGFLRGLRESGYVVGENVAVDARTYASPAELDRALAELATRRVDVIFVGSPGAALATRKAAPGIPVVCGSCGDPVENGLAASLARPGGNVTGLASLSAELVGKRVALMREVVPGLRRIAAFVYPANPGTPATLKAIENATRAVGVSVQRVDIRAAADFESAFRSAAAAGAGAVIIQDDPLVRSARDKIGELALRHRLPVAAGIAELADSGVLAVYGPDRVEMYRRAAVFVDRVLRGAKPAELPFEQASKLELILNLRTARALGLAIPQQVLLQADRVIE